MLPVCEVNDVWCLAELETRGLRYFDCVKNYVRSHPLHQKFWQCLDQNSFPAGAKASKNGSPSQGRQKPSLLVGRYRRLSTGTGFSLWTLQPSL